MFVAIHKLVMKYNFVGRLYHALRPPSSRLKQGYFLCALADIVKVTPPPSPSHIMYSTYSMEIYPLQEG